MDEIEYRQTYNEACKAVQAGDFTKAIQLLLQLVDGHQQAIEEMQTSEDEDEC